MFAVQNKFKENEWSIATCKATSKSKKDNWSKGLNIVFQGFHNGFQRRSIQDNIRNLWTLASSGRARLEILQTYLLIKVPYLVLI